MVLNNELITTAAINAYFKVNIIYFIYDYLETLSFMSIDDIASTVRERYKVDI